MGERDSKVERRMREGPWAGFKLMTPVYVPPAQPAELTGAPQTEF